MTKINGSLFVNLPNDKTISGTYSRFHLEVRKQSFRVCSNGQCGERITLADYLPCVLLGQYSSIIAFLLLSCYEDKMR